ncbi:MULTISPECIES: CatB-related O-acetyltransferase [Aeromonas]|uniref:CatB-related O-acetyltransferase n=1 Tax=Aeromonas TaxID=642 RepID=UPI0036DDB1D0
MLKKIIKFIYFKVKYRNKKLKLKTMNLPLGSVFGYMNTVESGVYIDGEFEIGDLSYINKNSILSNVIIGKFTSISSNCSIGGFEHPISYYTTHPIVFNDYYGAKKTIHVNVKKTVVGNDVWIGHGAIIKQGVTIADGAVIAAGAIVTKSIPPYEIWGGIPARKIKSRSVDRLPYNTKCWWELDIKRIQEWKEY